MSKLLRSAVLLAVMAVLSSGCTYFARISTDAAGNQISSMFRATDVSADGRYVVFHTDEAMVWYDSNGVSDVYRKDTQTGAVILISGRTNLVGDDASEWARISDDGRWVAFESKATNLVNDDTNGLRDVYLYDTVGQLHRRASVTSTGGESTFSSSTADISGDGRHVAFVANGPLDPVDTNTSSDVYRFDRATGSTEIVSASAAGVVGNLSSHDPSIDYDGSVVVFESLATNLGPTDTNGVHDIYAKFDTGFVAPVSRDGGGGEANGSSRSPSVSGNGLVVAFQSAATNLVPNDLNGLDDVFVKTIVGPIFLASVADDGVTQGSRRSQNASMNHDGTLVAFNTQAPELHGTDPGLVVPMVRDGIDGRTVPVGIAAPNGLDGGSGQRMSADGRYVLYTSNSTTVVTPDANGNTLDAFLAWWSVPEITGITPSTITLGATESVTITGEGFSRFAPVDIYTHIAGKHQITFADIVVVDHATITATVTSDADETPVGSFPLWVEQAGGGPGLVSGAVASCSGCLSVVP